MIDSNIGHPLAVKCLKSDLKLHMYVCVRHANKADQQLTHSLSMKAMTSTVKRVI